MQIFLSFLLSNLSLFLHFPKIFAFLNFFRTFGTPLYLRRGNAHRYIDIGLYLHFP